MNVKIALLLRLDETKHVHLTQRPQSRQVEVLYLVVTQKFSGMQTAEYVIVVNVSFLYGHPQYCMVGGIAMLIPTATVAASILQ